MDNKSIFKQATEDFERFIVNGSGHLDNQELTALSYHLDHLSHHEANDANLSTIDNKIKLKRSLSYSLSFAAGLMTTSVAVSQSSSLSGMLFLSSLTALAGYTGYKSKQDSEYYYSLLGEPKFVHLLKIRTLLSKGMGLSASDPLLSTEVIEAIASTCSNQLRTTIEQRVERSHLQLAQRLMSAMDDPLRHLEVQALYKSANEFRLLSDLCERINDIKDSRPSDIKNSMRNVIPKESQNIDSVRHATFSGEFTSSREKLTSIICEVSGLEEGDININTDKDLYKIALLVDSYKQSMRYIDPADNPKATQLTL